MSNVVRLKFKHERIVHVHVTAKTDYKLAAAARKPGTQVSIPLWCRAEPWLVLGYVQGVSVAPETYVTCLWCLARSGLL